MGGLVDAFWLMVVGRFIFGLVMHNRRKKISLTLNNYFTFQNWRRVISGGAEQLRRVVVQRT
jgi:hypothetical protein